MAGNTLFTYGPSNVDSLLSTTLSAVRKKMADNIFTRIPLFNWLKQKSKITENGGASVVCPVMFGKNSTAKPYSGYGIIDTTPQEGMTAAQYAWKQYAATVSISGLEEQQNRGDKAIIKLLEAKVKQAEMSLRDKLDVDMWATSTATNAILALPTIVDTTTSIGDISKSSNSWWQAQVTASGSFAARGLSDLRSLWNTIINNSVDGRSGDFICSAQSPYEFTRVRFSHSRGLTTPLWLRRGLKPSSTRARFGPLTPTRPPVTCSSFKAATWNWLCLLAGISSIARSSSPPTRTPRCLRFF